MDYNMIIAACAVITLLMGILGVLLHIAMRIGGLTQTVKVIPQMHADIEAMKIDIAVLKKV